MPKMCFYLHLHQPYRLKEFSVFDIGQQHSYFSGLETDGNGIIFQKVAHKSYIPTLTMLLKLIHLYPDFCCAFSCSGIFLEQAAEYAPKVLDLLKKLASTGKVEFLAETYYHSLASLYNPAEFRSQVELHQQKIRQLFGVRPAVFRNTELVYSNQIGQLVAKMNFIGMLTEGVPRYLHGRDKTQLFVNTTRELPLLLKHAQLSDDIAFRFSDKNWGDYPLTVAKYLQWIERYSENQIVNLFMDFETFGEHQWESTGIFTFFEEFVAAFLAHPWNTFQTPTQIFQRVHQQQHSRGKYKTLADLPIYDVPKPISWADVDRDLTAWIDNDFQQDTIHQIYSLGPTVQKHQDQKLLDEWRKLQTSDHFYYMCTKWSADGDVHAYFSPYQSPYEAYRRYSTVLADFREKLEVYQQDKP